MADLTLPWEPSSYEPPAVSICIKRLESYVLYLYVAGATPHSLRAVANLKGICAEYLAGNYTLEVVDLYQQPALAEGEQIIAVPTLIKKLPLPVRRIVGDLSDTARVLVALDLQV